MLGLILACCSSNKLCYFLPFCFIFLQNIIIVQNKVKSRLEIMYIPFLCVANNKRNRIVSRYYSEASEETSAHTCHKTGLRNHLRQWAGYLHKDFHIIKEKLCTYLLLNHWCWITPGACAQKCISDIHHIKVF